MSTGERDWAAHYEAAAATAEEEARDDYWRHRKIPLTASQHILHLLLTVFTAGLWAPVWIIRAIQGNRPPPG